MRIPIVALKVVQPADDAATLRAVASIEQPVERARLALRLSDGHVREQLDCLLRREAEGHEREHDVTFAAEQSQQADRVSRQIRWPGH